jgi:hypothetical protein
MKRVPNTEKCLHVTAGIRVPFLSKPSSFETSSRLCIVRENFGGLGSCSTVYCGQQTHRSHMRHLNLGRLALLLSLCSATACNHEDQLRNHLFQSTVGTHKVSKHSIGVPAMVGPGILSTSFNLEDHEAIFEDSSCKDEPNVMMNWKNCGTTKTKISVGFYIQRKLFCGIVIKANDFPNAYNRTTLIRQTFFKVCILDK